MNQIKNSLLILALVLFTSAQFLNCQSETEKVLSSESTVQNTKNSDSEKDSTRIEFTDSIHFNLVKKYIEKNGKHRRMSASSVAGDTSLMIDYYSISKEGWEITKDHHSRIYFSYNSHSFGNVFLEFDSAYVEPYYLGSIEVIDTLTEIRVPISKLYNELVHQALKE